MTVLKKCFYILISISIIFLGYLGYKSYLIINYSVNVNDEIINQLNKSFDVIKITTNNNVNDKSLTFKDIVYTKPDGFVFDEEQNVNGKSYLTYYLNEEDLSNYVAIFKIGKTYSIHDVLTSNKVSPFDVDFKKVNGKNLLEKYNLDNDYDIFKYIIEHYDNEVNIFSSIDEIKMNYLIKKYIKVVMPISKVNLIEGDLQGYMYTSNDDLTYEVHLIYNDNNYWFNFTNNQGNEYFNLEYVKNFISNIDFINK